MQDELDYGLVSVAVPVFGPSGAVVAATSCSDVASHLTKEASKARWRVAKAGR